MKTAVPHLCHRRAAPALTTVLYIIVTKADILVPRDKMTSRMVYPKMNELSEVYAVTWDVGQAMYRHHGRAASAGTALRLPYRRTAIRADHIHIAVTTQ